MKIIVPKGCDLVNQNVGGKARNLARLGEAGIYVPKWAVIPQEILTREIPDSKNFEIIRKQIEDLNIQDEIIQELKEYFGEDYLNKTYAVRSSAIDEDGEKFSFAGQFESFLNVNFSEIPEKIKKVWLSVVSDRVITYRKINNIPFHFGIGVIIQEMVDADVSGVAFGVDPVSGNTDKKVISAVYGLGEGIVSGELNADNFIVYKNKIETNLTIKKNAFIRNKSGGGLINVEIETEKQKQSTLNEKQIDEIINLLDKLETQFGKPQDIEFAYKNDELFLLQTRPVTTIISKPKGEYIVWDNSNIVESYPGITTPLTFSFIIKMYEFVYRQFIGLMGASKNELDKNSEVFANTLGLVRGRVYYNLLNWYKMLAMLPGYSLNAGFMEQMMGVKEKFDLDEKYQMKKGTARLRILMMIVKMLILHFRLPKETKRFKSTSRK